MNLSHLSTGQRVVASFAVVLCIMAGMTALALWRQQAAEAAMTELVDSTLATQQLIAEQLGAVRLNGLRALSIGRSDSIEVADFFQAQLAEGERSVLALEQALAPRLAGEEQALMREAARRKAAYLAARTAMFKLKDMGRTQQAGELIDSTLASTFGAYSGALEKALAHQSAKARAASAASAAQFGTSRALLAGLGVAALAIGALLSWRLTRSIVEPLKLAARHAARVAGGDLRGTIGHARRDEFGVLLDALGDMSRRLAATVQEVHAGSAAISLSSAEIASGNMDLSGRTERQASALQETTASMHELSQAVRQNSGSARDAHALAQEASSVAGRGGQAMEQVLDSMRRIEAFGRQIGEITGVIDGIAFQTNILALNAAVEAARAGEQGRGFAVVAAEVRSLAQRSASAAGEIRKLIEDSTATIGSGRNLAEGAARTMEQIVASVGDVTAVMAAISAASGEQERSIGQVRDAIGDLDDVTQQNAALVEQAAAAAQSMRDQAGALSDRIAYFST